MATQEMELKLSLICALKAEKAELEAQITEYLSERENANHLWRIQGGTVLKLDYYQRTADIDYSAYTDEGFCSKCRMLGSVDCPEDMLSNECPRNSTAWAIERVADAVNELL